jgi:hypothetical protein
MEAVGSIQLLAFALRVVSYRLEGSSARGLQKETTPIHLQIEKSLTPRGKRATAIGSCQRPTPPTITASGTPGPGKGDFLVSAPASGGIAAAFVVLKAVRRRTGSGRLRRPYRIVSAVNGGRSFAAKQGCRGPAQSQRWPLPPPRTGRENRSTSWPGLRGARFAEEASVS